MPLSGCSLAVLAAAPGSGVGAVRLLQRHGHAPDALPGPGLLPAGAQGFGGGGRVGHHDLRHGVEVAALDGRHRAPRDGRPGRARRRRRRRRIEGAPQGLPRRDAEGGAVEQQHDSGRGRVHRRPRPTALARAVLRRAAVLLARGCSEHREGGARDVADHSGCCPVAGAVDQRLDGRGRSLRGEARWSALGHPGAAALWGTRLDTGA
mmetsp:Transcript_44818/g.143556  ORF Transcript_44818/g.143556 Transcript_44818/m.143556 type:complete len:207 (-) Transcript_44818:354-974(-)